MRYTERETLAIHIVLPLYFSVLLHKHFLITHSLLGGLREYSKPIRHRESLSVKHLTFTLSTLPSPTPYNDLLFTTMLFVSFHALLCLGEMTQADSHSLCANAKHSRRDSICMLPDIGGFSFWLPHHKIDCMFEGSHVVITYNDQINPLPLFRCYLSRRDSLFPYLEPLWLTTAGVPPTRRWFLFCFCLLFPDHAWAGHSLHTGSATLLAELHTAYNLIQSLGHWSLESFRIYILKNPNLLTLLLHPPPPLLSP